MTTRRRYEPRKGDKVYAYGDTETVHEVHAVWPNGRGVTLKDGEDGLLWSVHRVHELKLVSRSEP